MSQTMSSRARLTRRSFLGATAAVAAGAVGAQTAPSLVQGKAVAANGAEEIYSVACTVNCNSGHCTMNAHVREGKLYKLTAKTGLDVPDEMPVYEFDRRPCLRGRSHVQAIYHPDRIKYPMRRVGERGSGQWERITWDEAIEEIGATFNDIQRKYGTRAVAMPKMWGSNGTIQGNTGIQRRFITAIEGTYLNDCLDEGLFQGIERVYGSRYGTSNSWWDIANAKSIVFWAVNATDVWMQNWYWVVRARENGAKVLCIDPRYSITAQKSDTWVPIRQGTDGALAMGVINYLIANGLYDNDFVRDHTVASFLVRRDTGAFLRADEANVDYVSDSTADQAPAVVWDNTSNSLVVDGNADDPATTGIHEVAGIPVDTAWDLLCENVREYTPERVEELTGVDEEMLHEIVMAFADGPTTMWLGYGLDRYDNSHCMGHALATIVGLTGNVGKPGAGYGYPNVAMGRIFMSYPQMLMFDEPFELSEVPWLCLPDILQTGTFKGQPYEIKALLVVSGNPFSNHAEQKELLEEILPSLELIVTHDYRMTDTCRYSDIVLPAAHGFEDFELLSSAFLHLGEKAIDPLYEAKSNTEFLSQLAAVMGKGEYFTQTSEDIARAAIDSSQDMAEAGINFDVLQEQGSIFNIKESGYDALWVKDFKFPSPSGKLEFYCESTSPRMDYGQQIDQSICHLPMDSHPREAWSGSDRREQYPIVLYQEHSRWRVHSMFGHLPWLRELDPEPVVKLNPDDARDRDIVEGDVVVVFNDRGSVTLKATIDASLPRGMGNLPKGWQRDQFIAGGYQELTSRYLNPITVNQSYADVLVEVKKDDGVTDHE